MPVRLPNSITYINTLTVILPPLNGKPQDQEPSSTSITKIKRWLISPRVSLNLGHQQKDGENQSPNVHHNSDSIFLFFHCNFYCVGGAREE